MSDVKKIMEMIKENDVTYVDVRFTDPRGKMQHLSQHVDTIDEESLKKGSCLMAPPLLVGKRLTNQICC